MFNFRKKGILNIKLNEKEPVLMRTGFFSFKLYQTI